MKHVFIPYQTIVLQGTLDSALLAVCPGVLLSVHKILVICVVNSSYNFAAIVLKFCIYIDRGMKLRIMQFSTIYCLSFKDFELRKKIVNAFPNDTF